jgi:hypothetical protein
VERILRGQVKYAFKEVKKLIEDGVPITEILDYPAKSGWEL